MEKHIFDSVRLLCYTWLALVIAHFTYVTPLFLKNSIYLDILFIYISNIIPFPSLLSANPHPIPFSLLL